MAAAERSAPVGSILDGLEFLISESLRGRRADLAEELVKALHAVAEIEELRLADGTHRAGMTEALSRLPSSLPREPEPAATKAAVHHGIRSAAPPDRPLSHAAPANVVSIHTARNPARGLHLCLEQLRTEAISVRLSFVAHLIQIASEAALEEGERGDGP